MPEAIPPALGASPYSSTSPNAVFLLGAALAETERIYADALVASYGFSHIDAATLPSPTAASLYTALSASSPGSKTVVTGFPSTMHDWKAWQDLSNPSPDPTSSSSSSPEAGGEGNDGPHLAAVVELDSDGHPKYSPASAIATTIGASGTLLRRLPSSLPPRSRGLGLLVRALGLPAPASASVTSPATATAPTPAPATAYGATSDPVVTPLPSGVDVIFLIAPPGAGKKAVASHLASVCDCAHVDAADALAAAAAATAAAGAAAAGGAASTDAAAPVLSPADAAAVGAAMASGDLAPAHAAVAAISAAAAAAAASAAAASAGEKKGISAVRPVVLVTGFPRAPGDRAAWETAHAGAHTPAATVVLTLPTPSRPPSPTLAPHAAAARPPIAMPGAGAGDVAASLVARGDPPSLAAAKAAVWASTAPALLAEAEAEPGAGGVVRVPAPGPARGAAVVANAVRRALLGAGSPLHGAEVKEQVTYAMIKPDAVAAGFAPGIMRRIAAAGFQVVARKEFTLPRDVAEEFYAEHKARPFFGPLVAFMTSGPVVALALKKKGAVLAWRRLAGPTNSHRARAISPTSIRAAYGLDGSLNAVHGADSLASANRELSLIFGSSIAAPLLNPPPPGARVILSGGPASGKGTQAELLRDRLGLVHISTGELLRRERKAGSALGKKAAEYTSNGLLVPDDVMIPLVLARLKESDCEQRGWLLDGFPRTPAQARALKQAQVGADVCVVIDVPDEVLVERVTGRVMCTKTGKIYHEKYNPPPADAVTEKRADDSEPTARARIATFKQHVAEIKDVFGDIVVVVRGDRNKHAVFDDVLDQLPAAL